MMIFLLLCLPLLCVYSFASETEKAPLNKTFPYTGVLMGLLAGAVYSFTEFLFTSSYYLTPYAFWLNYFFYTFFEIILPAGFCLVLFIVFVKKQPNRFTLFYFILLGFYIVYLPARIIHRNTVFNWFLLFIKPLLYTAMLIGLKNTISMLYCCGKFELSEESSSPDLQKRLILPAAKKAAVPISVLSTLVLLPPALEVWYLLAIPKWPFFAVLIIYAAGASVGTKLWIKLMPDTK